MQQRGERKSSIEWLRRVHLLRRGRREGRGHKMVAAKDRRPPVTIDPRIFQPTRSRKKKTGLRERRSPADELRQKFLEGESLKPTGGSYAETAPTRKRVHTQTKETHGVRGISFVFFLYVWCYPHTSSRSWCVYVPATH